MHIHTICDSPSGRAKFILISAKPTGAPGVLAEAEEKFLTDECLRALPPIVLHGVDLSLPEVQEWLKAKAPTHHPTDKMKSVHKS